MLDFYEKRRLKSLVYSKPMAAVIFIGAALLSVSAFERLEIEREMAERRTEKAEELAQLKLRAAALEREVEYLESDRGIEGEIRDRFEVAKEGEQVIVIVDNNAKEETRGSNARSQEARPSFFERFKFW